MRPTLNCNKTHGRQGQGHYSKREEEADGQHGEGGEQQQSHGDHGVAADVAARTGVDQPGHLERRRRHHDASRPLAVKSERQCFGFKANFRLVVARCADAGNEAE